MPRRGSGQAKKLSGIDLGKRLKYLRQDKKISVKELAEGAGVQESYIKQLNWEKKMRKSKKLRMTMII